MLENYFKHPYTLRRLRSGPAGPHLEGFATVLRAGGYAKLTMRTHLRSAAHFAQWAQTCGIELNTLDEAALQAFEKHLPTCNCLRHDSPDMRRYSRIIVDGALWFLRYLRQAGVAPALRDEAKALPVPALIEGFERWMRHHRGVKDTTLRCYRTPLLALVEALGDAPTSYDAAGLRRFVLSCVDLHGRTCAKQVASAARMFLRYLATEGCCEASLVDAIPNIAGWSLASLPRYLPAEAIERLISSCNTEAPTGLRDQAILLLLARLGLRSADIVDLRLKDLDWLGARLRVTGKGRRESRLPLSQEVGDAISRYLEHGRPLVDDDHVFITAQAPIGPFHRPYSISGIVKKAVQRTGLKTCSRGAHILRHSAATEMLRQGASLSQIGVVLRHRSINTTAIYAKVDFASLLAIAQPWPCAEVSPC